jgi:CBS domain-containing protein
MQVSDIMHREVVTVAAGDSFAQVAAVLHEHGISSVVVQDDGTPTGIVTERDVVNVVATGEDPSSISVGDRMSTNLTTADARTEIVDAARLMAERKIRHLPVMDRGSLAGIISIRDLLSWAVEEVTGGHELSDIVGGSAALNAAVQADSGR